VSHRQRQAQRISFHFPSAAAAQRYLVHARDWLEYGTVLAYVRGSRESALIDLEALLDRAR